MCNTSTVNAAGTIAIEETALGTQDSTLATKEMIQSHSTDSTTSPSMFRIIIMVLC